MEVSSEVERISSTDPEWMRELRKKSLNIFLSTQMPDLKNESWKYTRLTGIDLNEAERDKTEIEIKNSDKRVTAVPIRKAFENHLEIRNYFLKTKFSDAEAKFVALNSAIFNSGYFIHVPKDTKIDLPVLANITSREDSFSHSIVVLEENSSLNLFERMSSSENSRFFFNISEIFVGKNSLLNFFHLQKLSNTPFSFIVKNAEIEKDGELNWFTGSFGGKLNRSRIENRYVGEGARSETLCMFSGNSDQHFDLITNSHHMVPNTKNNTLARGVLFDSCSSVYRGLIRIEKEAQKTDSYLADHTLMMSEKSLANSIPSLQIEANDVKATHGASVGQVNEEELFYLMSRGIERRDAERLIVSGFFEKFLSRIHLEDIRKEFEDSIQQKVV